MELNIKTPSEHGYRMIAVPSEKLKGKPVSDYTTLVSNSVQYEIISQIKVCRNDIFPYTFFLLATGKYVEQNIVWNTYKNSEFIYLFIVKKIERI